MNNLAKARYEVDMRTVVESVNWLLSLGYRQPARSRIRQGMIDAMEVYDKNDWARLVEYELQDSIEEFYQLGAP